MLSVKRHLGIDGLKSSESEVLGIEAKVREAEPRLAPFARGEQEARELAPGVLFFPYFGTSTAFLTPEGVVLFDAGTYQGGGRVLGELRKRTDLPVHTIVFSHGHMDHAPGAAHFVKEAAAAGRPNPRIIGHRKVVDRLRRYERMAPWISFIGEWQWDRRLAPAAAARPARQQEFVYPDTLVDDRLTFTVGGERFDLFHGIGETDDQLWLWNEARSLVCAGDFIENAAPNVGNPWKVQRYTVEWAEALDSIAATRPEILVPGHGQPATEAAAIEELLLTTAAYLRSIHDQVVERMNAGQWLEQILAEVEPPADLAAKPWLQPVYGHHQFIVHGVWRQYGGWWDGNPASFFPARTQAQADEIVGAAGADVLLSRAQARADAGDLPLACHLVDWVRRAEPDNADAWKLWADLFERRASVERNMMARNTFRPP